MPEMPMAANQHEPSIKDEDDDGDEFFDDDDEGRDFTYKPCPRLPQPFVVMRTLGDLMKALDAGSIDVDPEYQREVVWTADRMTGLVNSLMENYYIPPIILNKKEYKNPNGNGSSYSMVCVDGKQRLSSVRAFIKGMIPCHDYRGQKWWFVDPSNKPSKRILPEAARKEFLGKDLVSTEFSGLTPEQEEDLFARVQMGMQLTLAEKMRASNGPWQELAKLFVDDFAVIFALLKDRARSKDFQLALSCFSQIIEVENPSNANGIPMLKTNYKSLPKLLSNHAAMDDQIRSHLANTFATFKELVQESPETFTNVERKLKGVQTFAPIELVAVAVLISMYSHKRNNKLLLGDIRTLRNRLRDNFVDIRMNAPVWKFIWGFLNDLEAYRGTIEGVTIDRNVRLSVPVSDVTGTPAQKAPGSSPGSAKRRGRPTARPKQASFVAVNAASSVVPVEPHPPKRQRVEQRRPKTFPGSVVYPPFPGDSVHGFVTTGVGSSALPLVIDDDPAPPHPASRRQPSKALAASSQRHTPSMSRIGTNEYKFTTPPVPTSPDEYSGMHCQSPHTPSTLQVRQNHVSEMSSNGSPMEPMEPMGMMAAPVSLAQMAPAARILQRHPQHQQAQQHHHQTRQSQRHHQLDPVRPHPQPNQPQHRTQPQQPPPAPSRLNTSATLVHVEDQLQAILNAAKSSSPEEPHPPQLARSYPQSLPRKFPTPSPPQLNGTIDLTDDVEEERQNLLSSFGSRATAASESIENKRVRILAEFRAMKNPTTGSRLGLGSGSGFPVAGGKREQSMLGASSSP
ncbi:uncharacterized protein BDR25DRAFT_318039 [Lindgomyces ingoldianus]|uniref:Uncharacterized protein n=1 Tax=Lindgomyces ingoldianus TaxID=673940 RepID=A0ACB6QIE3_9PLEO|nr:uncharacterized protein BDR25DRAFT_318039 [Lindgomyces ingoldianus]KAF2465892.1 hypothetical protein BDR25DRAFT_318039 [Lindgomyces ingoldianus]